jgi:cytochrome c6
MIRFLIIILAVAALSFMFLGQAVSEGKINGKAEFIEHCAACHPDGGNVINSAKTLKQKDLKVNGLNKPEDIVKLMRNPGPGMTKFDKKTVPDKTAKTIAEYIFKTFK